MRTLAILSVTLLLTGCAEHPERACASPAAQDIAVDLIFEKVNRSIEGTQWDMSPEFVTELKATVTKLRQEKFVTLEHVTLKKYDKSTKLTTCGVEAHFHLTAQDKKLGEGGLADLNIMGITPPEDLYGTDPFDNIEFGSQPTPDGKDTSITETDIPGAVSAVLAVALRRTVDKPKA